MNQADTLIAGWKACRCACATLRARASRTVISSCCCCCCCCLPLGSQTDASCTYAASQSQDCLTMLCPDVHVGGKQAWSPGATCACGMLCSQADTGQTRACHGCLQAQPWGALASTVVSGQICSKYTLTISLDSQATFDCRRCAVRFQQWTGPLSILPVS